MFNLQIRLLLIALRTWSRVAGVSGVVSPEDVARSARYAPIVGLVVAVGASVVYALVGAWLPHPLALLAALGTAMLLTGAVHEHGFAMLCEARHPASSNGDPGRGLATAGVLGLGMLLLARYETLSILDPTWIGISLICGASLSRGCAVLVTATLSPSVETPEGAPAGPGTLELGVAAACALAPLVAAIGWTGDAGLFLTGMATAVIAALILRRVIARRLGGACETGFGAAQQACELAFHLGIVAVLALIDEAPADQAP